MRISIILTKQTTTTITTTMTEQEIDVYYKAVLDLVSLAGKVVNEGFSITKHVETKSGAADLVTEFDQRVEEILIKSLRETFPTHKFIGEESAAAGAKTVFGDDPTWIIDPIDGTTNFVHGFPFVAISIALAIKKEVVIGVIYNPVLDKLYSAVRGKGAFRNGRPIKCSGQKDLALSQVAGEYGSSREPHIIDAKCQNMRVIIEKVHSIRAVGSAAMNLCMVAEGSCDAYFEYGIHIWDYAAGDLIAREAGAYTSDPSGGPLNLLHRCILCTATKELAQQITPLLTHMKINSLLFVAICASAFFSAIHGATDAECKQQSNKDCDACLKLSDCGFCKSSKACFKYNVVDQITGNCSSDDLQVGTCIGNFKGWIIAIIVVAVVVLIAVAIGVWCLCRKCKKRRIRKEERRQEIDDQRMEERRAAAEVRTAERNRVADEIRMKYGNVNFDHLITNINSILFCRIIIVNPRLLSTIITRQKKDSKQQENDTLAQSPTNQTELISFTQKAQQAAKDSIYSLVIIAGVVTLSGLCYLILHELYSRETPNGIYKEVSRLCLANTDVQDALGAPILVHTTPKIRSMRMSHVRAKMFDEKGHRSMTISFYLTGKERSGVVAVKVRKNISNKFVYDYILVQLDRPWRNRNIIQVHQNLNQLSFDV
ncbi:unnamed protein product [Adineta ricciae]|uniref:inositol-phosphate phosphatase n=1 Tax=Adineta ricciae TaxID=249248 RepID=A0A814UJ85_ADIRI|nr:unnamed protein product [Adineta ricciae]